MDDAPEPLGYYTPRRKRTLGEQLRAIGVLIVIVAAVWGLWQLLQFVSWEPSLWRR